MGLLDFDVSKITNNDAFMLGMGILGNNSGHYGNIGPALGGGLKDYNRQKSLQAQQARANASAQRQQSEADIRQKQFEQQQAEMVRQRGVQQAQQVMMAKKYPEIAGLPQFAQQAAIKAKYSPKGGVVGSPQKLGSGNYGYMGQGGKMHDTGTPFFNPFKNVNVNGVPYNFNSRTGQMGTPQAPQGKQPITHETIIGQKAKEAAKLAEVSSMAKIQDAKNESASLAGGAIGYVHKARELVQSMNDAQLGPIAVQTPNFSESAQLLDQQLTNLIGNVRTKLGPGLLSDTDIKLLKRMIPHMGMDKAVLLESLDLFEAEINRIISEKTGGSDNQPANGLTEDEKKEFEGLKEQAKREGW